MADQEQYVIDSIDVALDVIEYLADTGGQPSGPSEIARELDISRSRAFRILKTLERRHYLRSDQETGEFNLGFKFLSISEKIHNQTMLRREAEPILLDLARRTGETILLVVRDGDAAVDLVSYEGDHILQAAVRVGERHPLHIGASNKILLAFLPESERECLIRQMPLTRFTDSTVTSRDELRDQLAKIRVQGYAVDVDSYEVGVHAIGAPLRDHTGDVVAGVTLTAPSARCGPDRRKELIESVIDAANGISKRLGGLDRIGR